MYFRHISDYFLKIQPPKWNCWAKGHAFFFFIIIFYFRILLHISKLPSRKTFQFTPSPALDESADPPTPLSTPSICIIFNLNKILLLLLCIFQYPCDHSFFFFLFLLLYLLTYLVRKCRLQNWKLSRWTRIPSSRGSRSHFAKKCCWNSIIWSISITPGLFVGLRPKRKSAKPKENVNVCGLFIPFGDPRLRDVFEMSDAFCS